MSNDLLFLMQTLLTLGLVLVCFPFFLTELNHPRRMETIREGLEGRGFTSGEVEKSLWGNWYRLFRDVWPA